MTRFRAEYTVHLTGYREFTADCDPDDYDTVEELAERLADDGVPMMEITDEVVEFEDYTVVED